MPEALAQPKHNRQRLPVALCYPAVACWLLLQRARGLRLRYLAMCNPGMPFSGLFGVSKIEMAEACVQYSIPQPASFAMPAGDGCPAGGQIRSRHKRWIAKPEFGARSKGLRVLVGDGAIDGFGRGQRDARWLVQRFVKGEEYSVFLVRDPATGSLRIDHLIRRWPLILVGDGMRTIADLAATLPRHQRRAIREKFRGDMSRILGRRFRIAVSAFGTRASGTEIREVGEPYPEQLRSVVENIECWQGIDYCRVDMMRDEKTGQWLVLEINGALAVPLHAYDTDKSLIASYNAFTRSLQSALILGRSAHLRAGVMPGRLLVAAALMRGWLRYRRARRVP